MTLPDLGPEWSLFGLPGGLITTPVNLKAGRPAKNDKTSARNAKPLAGRSVIFDSVIEK
jgi:hypothetical protein